MIGRQREHYLDLIGARSVIPSSYRDGLKDWSLGNQFDHPAVLLDRERYKALVDSAFDYLADIKVRLCPLPELDDQTISNIESNLIYTYKPWCNTKGINSTSAPTVNITMAGDWPGEMG